MKTLITALCLIVLTQIGAQELINGTYDFQSDPDKKYSIYIPSSYEEGTPTDMMLGLHPWNTSRWNANSWCDTLKTFAEANNLLLVCPDGGADGKVDDAIDTAFTTFLIDEVRSQYTINDDQIYAVGFSWGAKTVYTYGLQHAERFAGFIPVGAAVQSSEVSPHVTKASDKKFYVIHGSQDSPSVRFTPIVDMLDGPHCVESQLLQGIGHTIDFSDRNNILTSAFQYLKSSTCGVSNSTKEEQKIMLMSQNILNAGDDMQLGLAYDDVLCSVVNMNGESIYSAKGNAMQAPNIPGHYILITKSGVSQQFVVVR